ncbi:MAG: choice-of-anchor D domain-containing protein [Planctomycetes bacterium]|nr:choice-of-anchor D domain-containing protein [Planctomycetota bacterium]NUQ34440.1 choice-of-anchor D domain-containing protein [Planctomycetaceae bacterium]
MSIQSPTFASIVITLIFLAAPVCAQAFLQVNEVDQFGSIIENGSVDRDGRKLGEQDIANGVKQGIKVFIRNTGSANLTLGLPVLSGISPDQFVLNTSGYWTTVPPGMNTSFLVNFDPDTTGFKTAYVSFTHNAPNTNAPFIFEVSGVGSTDQWTTQHFGAWYATSRHNAPMNRGRHGMVSTGDQTIIWGGWDAFTNPLDNGGVYDVETNAWLDKPNLNNSGSPGAPMAHSSPKLIWAGAYLLVLGSSPDTRGVYDLQNDVWLASKANLINSPYYFYYRCMWDQESGKLLVFYGGDGNETLKALYDLAADTWIVASSPPIAPRGCTNILRIPQGYFIWGGSFYETGMRYDDGAIFHPETNTWSQPSGLLGGAPNASEPRTEHLTRYLPSSGKVFIFGGTDALGELLPTGNLYDPVTDTWSQITQVNGPFSQGLYNYYYYSMSQTSQMLFPAGESVIMDDEMRTYDVATNSWRDGYQAVYGSVFVSNTVMNWGESNVPSNFDPGKGLIFQPNVLPGLLVREDNATDGFIIKNGAVPIGERDFGLVSTTSSDSSTFYIQNTGTTLITLGVPTISGDTGDFSLNTTGSNTVLSQNQSTSFTITFAPTSGGDKRITLSFTHDALNDSSPFSFDLIGEGQVPPIPLIDVRENDANGVAIINGSAASGGRDFGEQQIDLGQSAPLTIFVRNSGGVDLDLGLPTAGGSDGEAFVVSANAFPVTLAEGESASFTIAFDPVDVGAKNADITFTHNGVNSPTPFMLKVSGIGVPVPAPAIEVHDVSVAGPLVANGAAASGNRDFGEQDINVGESSSRTIVVRNIGDADMTLGTPQLGGADAGEFILFTSSFTSTLAPAASTSFTMTFDPSTEGTKSASVSFVHDGDNTSSPFSFSIAGSGIITPAALIELREQSVDGVVIPSSSQAENGRDFGQQSIDAGATAPLAVHVLNTGTAVLNLGAVQIVGGDAASFVLNTSGMSSALTPGQSTSFTLAFDPATLGVKAALVQLFHDAANESSPFSFFIEGEGVPAPVPVIDVREQSTGGPVISHGGTPAGGAFGDIEVGASSAIFTVVIRNEGTAQLQLGTPLVEGAASASFDLHLDGYALTVDPGAATSFGVSFSPSSEGAAQCQVRFTHNDASTSAPFWFNVSGSGIVHHAGHLVVLDHGTGGEISHDAPAAGSRDFGERGVADGASAPALIELRNDGDAAITLGFPVLSGDDASDFALNLSGASTVLDAAESVLFAVVFDPSSSGPKHAYLSFAHDAPNATTPFGFHVSGIAVAPAMPSLDVREGTLAISHGEAAHHGRLFADRNVADGPSDWTSITVSNSGDAPLVLGLPQLSGLNAVDFALDLTSFSSTLAPANSTVFRVAFDPSSTGTKVALVSFTHNALNAPSPFSFALGGAGVQDGHGRIEVTLDGIAISHFSAPAQGNFGPVTVGASAQASLTVMMKNTGDGVLALSQPQALGQHAGDFPLDSSAMALVLAPGELTSFTVAFSPQAQGAREANITIAHDGDNVSSPFVFMVAGTGEAPLASGIAVREGIDGGLSITAGSSAMGARIFADQLAGAGSSESLEIVISNTGSAPLVLATPTLAGSAAIHFAIDASSMNLNLDVSEETRFSLRFVPLEPGLKVATLLFEHNAANAPSPFSFNISGVGIEADQPPPPPPATESLQIDFPVLFAAHKGMDFSGQLTANGGVPAYTWQIASGPEWLSIDPATGAISGVPPMGPNRAEDFTVVVTDNDGNEDSVVMYVVIGPPAGENGEDVGVGPDKAPSCSMRADSSGGIVAVLGLLAAAIMALRRGRLLSRI